MGRRRKRWDGSIHERSAEIGVDSVNLSIQLNAVGFGLAERARGFRDGEMLDLGTHKLRFLETPHVHHWDSMMVIDETSRSLFPSDLFIQPADQPPVVTENLSMPMLDLYRAAGIFAHELPIRQVVDRLEKMNLGWVHPMHGGSFEQNAFPNMRERCVKTNSLTAGCYSAAKSRKLRRCKTFTVVTLLLFPGLLVRAPSV